MNERIRELMEQAMELVDPYAIEGEFGPRQLNTEKFAELIVRECVDQCADMPSSNDERDIGIRWAANQIQEHFGVKS